MAKLTHLEAEILAGEDNQDYSDAKWPEATRNEADGWNSMNKRALDIIRSYKGK